MASHATKRALCVGVNTYPNPQLELKGCVNDAKGWAALLHEHYDFTTSDITVLRDKRATKAKVMAALDAMLADARRGDVLVFTNSSHGTYRADESGDESLYDEALCPYDCEDELIIDDEHRERFAAIPKGVRLTVIADSCHSGSGTRDPDDLLTPDQRRKRYCDPREIGLPVIDDVRRTAHPRADGQFPESGMNELLLSGCRSDQYSYDARFGRTFHGAMSFLAKQIIADAGYRLTYGQLHRRLVPMLRDHNYDQEPQLEGRTAFKRRQIFT
jgi:hypothetical protein